MIDPHPDSPIGRVCDADRRRREPVSTDEALWVNSDGTIGINFTLVGRLHAEREPDLDLLRAEREPNLRLLRAEREAQ